MLSYVDYVIQLRKVNGIIVSNNLTLGLSLQTHLDDISGFIVEKAMGISKPRYRSEKHDGLLGCIVWLMGDDLLANLLILRWLTLGVRGVSVHIVSINCTRHFGDKVLFY
jgi:hypothetical protein